MSDAAPCGAWCLAMHYAASVRCLRPEGHDGMHLSDNPNGDRFSWEPVNFDPFLHTEATCAQGCNDT